MAETALIVEPLDGRAGLRLVGDVDLATVDELRAALAAVDPPRDLRLELADLHFIDVAGTAALVHEAARLGDGHAIVLRDPPYALLRILDVLWRSHPGIRMEAP